MLKASVVAGVIMAGGRGRRANDPEKCLWPLCGIPLLFRVAGALAQVAEELIVLTTKNHTRIAKYAEAWGIKVVYTPGEGYERDVQFAVKFAPAFIASCDLANLKPGHLEALANNAVFTTAVTKGGYPGLSYLPTPDMEKWSVVELGDLYDVDTPEDFEKAERECPTAYPLNADPNLLKPHEEVLEFRKYEVVKPIAVDYKTGVILDGHHRYAFLKNFKAVPVLLFDYDVIETNIDKRVILQAAYSGRLLPPKTTWHTYRGRHISQIPTIDVPIAKLLKSQL
ncbi:NTP transferase domain-containing protein [Pyrobaculum aerophilum]|nr:NTP transferase domain-containing protein [Pyrobaculum aerophilum]